MWTDPDEAGDREPLSSAESSLQADFFAALAPV